MLGYIPAMLKNFQHLRSFKCQYSPHPAPTITYGAKIQWANKEKDLPTLDKDGINLVQQIIGSALYLGRMIDNTILVTCNDIEIQQTKTELSGSPPLPHLTPPLFLNNKN